MSGSLIERMAEELLEAVRGSDFDDGEAYRQVHKVLSNAFRADGKRFGEVDEELTPQMVFDSFKETYETDPAGLPMILAHVQFQFLHWQRQMDELRAGKPR